VGAGESKNKGQALFWMTENEIEKERSGCTATKTNEQMLSRVI
jgi:hypothetical protein